MHRRKKSEQGECINESSVAAYSLLQHDDELRAS